MGESPHVEHNSILPASSSEFALPSSLSLAPIQSTDEFNPVLTRFRRPSLAFYISSLNLVQMRMKSNQKHNSSASLRHFPSCPRSLERHERHRTAVDTPRRLKKSLRERTHQATTATTTATHLHSGYLLLATPSVSASLAPLPVVSRVASTEMICLLTARAVRWQWK